jgi:hypothetical protein
MGDDYLMIAIMGYFGYVVAFAVIGGEVVKRSLKRADKAIFLSKIIKLRDQSFRAIVWSDRGNTVKQHSSRDLVESRIWCDDTISILTTGQGVWP